MTFKVLCISILLPWKSSRWLNATLHFALPSSALVSSALVTFSFLAFQAKPQVLRACLYMDLVKLIEDCKKSTTQ